MSYFTDIASEIYEQRKGKIPNGVSICRQSENNILITKVQIQREGLNRAKGNYITLDMPLAFVSKENTLQSALALSKQLSGALPSEGALLVCGIGNREITADALGVKTAEAVLASNGQPPLSKRCIYVITTGVEGASGVKSSRYIKAVVKELKPAAVLCIDSLLTRSPLRLGTSVQLCTSGLAVGTAKEISPALVGAPVIALGVPTMMQLKHKAENELVLTCKNIDVIIKHSSNLLSLAINKAIYPSLSFEEIEFITS